MKHIFITLFFLPILASAQDCALSHYRQLILEANDAAFGKTPDYQLAVNKLLSAKTCQPDSEAVVNVKLLQVFTAVNRQRELAVWNERIAQSNALVNEADVLYENTNHSYQLAWQSYQKNPANNLVITALYNIFYQRSFFWNDTSYAAPFYRDAYKYNQNDGQIRWAHAASDGSRMVVGQNNALNLLDEKTRLLVAFRQETFADFKLSVVKISPLGRYLGVVMNRPDSCRFLLFDIDTRQSHWIEIPGTNMLGNKSETVTGLAFSPDEHTVAVSFRRSILLWNIETGALEKSCSISGIARDTITNINFQARGKNILVVTPDTIKNWNYRNNSISAIYTDTRSNQNRFGYLDAQAVPGQDDLLLLLEQRGSKVARFNGRVFSGRLQLVQTGVGKTGNLLYEDPPDKKVTYTHAEFLQAGLIAASSADDAVYILNCFTKTSGNTRIKELIRLVGHTHDTGFACTSSDRKGVYTFSVDNTIKYWDLLENPLDNRRFSSLGPQKTNDYWHLSAFSPDFQQAAWCRKEAVLCYDFNLGRMLVLYRFAHPPLRSVKTEWMDAKTLAVAEDDSFVIVDVSIQKIRFRAGCGSDITSLKADTSGNTLWVLAGDSVFQVQNGVMNSVLTLPDLADLGNTGKIDKKLLLARRHSPPLMYDLQRGKLEKISGLSSEFAPTGAFAIFGPVAVAPAVRANFIFSDDLSLLATTADDYFNGTIRLNDLKNNRSVYLMGHSDRIVSMDFSDDKRFLITASLDRTVRIWDRQGQELIKREINGEIEKVAFVHNDQEYIILYAVDPTNEPTQLLPNPVLDFFGFKPGYFFKKRALN